MMQKLIYISSLSHSGSTLLDLILGSHPKFIGLGEIARVFEHGPSGLEKTRQVICSCGSGVDECIFWSNVVPELEGVQNLSLADGYKIVLEVFNSVFGDDFIPVDSSKYLRPLRILLENMDLDLSILYMIKDVRAYVVSQIDDARRENFGRKRSNSFYQFRSWYRWNKSIKQYLEENEAHFFQLGYEELCFAQEYMVQKICEFLGVEPIEGMFALENSSSHVIRGNRMRSQADKLTGISYDNRWFIRREWSLPSVLFPGIMDFNKREVYAHNVTQKWNQ